VGALAPRPDHAVVRPAVSLLSDPDGLDRRLSERVAAQDGVSSTLVERHELPYRVWLPSWRRERDRGLPVVVHLTGSWPRTLQELFGVLAPGPLQRWSGSDPVDPVPLLGALLSGRPQRLFAGAQPAPHERGDTGHLEREADRDGAGDPVRHEAVVRLVAAAVRVAAVEQRRFTLGWHDVWGAQLLDAEGAAAPLEAFVGDAVARRDVGALTEWLAEVGVAIDVAWEHAEPPPGGLDALPITAFAARQGARGVDAVVLDGWLLGYPHPSRTRLRGLLGRACASDTAELLTLARTHRDSLVDVADPAASARLADVTSARLESATGRGWTLCLELPDRRLDLAGDGPVGPVAATLTGALGGRLACGGAAAPGSPGRAWPAVLLGSMATVAAALTMVTAVLAALGWGPTGLVPGDGPLDRVVAVLALGSVPVLLLRLAGAETARAMGRRGPDPRGPAGRVPPAGG